MWSILAAAPAIVLAQAQPGPAEKWCFERGQHGAQLCEETETGCNDLLQKNPEIATGPCLRLQSVEEAGSTAPAVPSNPPQIPNSDLRR